MKICAVVILFALAIASSAHADNLFPPNNIGDDPGQSCPNGQVLKWTGRGVDCADPTLGVKIECPSGQVLRGIDRGTPLCEEKPPAIIGGAEVVSEDNTGIFGYCRLVWGAAVCGAAGNVSCNKGQLIVVGMAHDQIGSGEDMSSGKFISRGGNGAHVGQFACVY